MAPRRVGGCERELRVLDKPEVPDLPALELEETPHQRVPH